MFILGFITGIALCIFVTVVLKRYETPIHRNFKQINSKLQTKGSIIEPELEELEGWVKSIEK